MADESGKSTREAGKERCDIRVWCEACRRDDYRTEGDKYLCASCGKIMVIDHEMRHEPFPHLSGDEDNLS